MISCLKLQYVASVGSGNNIRRQQRLYSLPKRYFRVLKHDMNYTFHINITKNAGDRILRDPRIENFVVIYTRENLID